MEPTDAELMQAVSQHNHAAFTALVNRYVDSLYRYALRLAGSATAAEDLLQETWMIVWQKADSFRPRRAALSTWLHRIVHNKFIDQTRKHTPELNNDAVDWAIDQRNLEQEQQASAEFAQLQSALYDLPVNQRAALLLVHSQGMSNIDVAQVLNTSVRAVESLLARARRSLKQQLQATEDTHAR